MPRTWKLVCWWMECPSCGAKFASASIRFCSLSSRSRSKREHHGCRRCNQGALCNDVCGQSTLTASAAPRSSLRPCSRQAVASRTFSPSPAMLDPKPRSNARHDSAVAPSAEADSKAQGPSASMMPSGLSKGRPRSRKEEAQMPAPCASSSSCARPASRWSSQRLSSPPSDTFRNHSRNSPPTAESAGMAAI